MSLSIIHDCDPGNDDALGILVAAGHAALDLRAVTTGAGHLAFDRTARNAAIAAAAAGLELPVTAGAAAPLVRERLIAQLLDQTAGLDPVRHDLPALPLDPRHSVEMIAEIAQRTPITVVATGPLTNLAMALRRYPVLAGRLLRIVTLGGAWGLGNKTAAAEWNILCDPEAAAIVYGSGVPITMIPVEASGMVPIDDALIAATRALPGPAAALAVELMASLMRTFKPGLFGPAFMPLHDPCALLLAAQPELARTVPARVEIELAGRHTYGRSVIDFTLRSGPANAEVAISFDAAATQQALLAALRAIRH